MARQRHQHDAGISEEIPLAVHGLDGLSVVPIRAEIAGRLCARRFCGFDLTGVGEDRGLAEELVAAAMVGVEMRIDDDIDIVGLQPDTGEARQQGLVRAHERLHDLRERSPALLGMIDHGGMTAGVEQHVALFVPDQGTADGKIDHLATVGTGHVNALLHAKTPGGEEIELHGVFSTRRAAALLIAATMFWYPVQRQRLPESPSLISSSLASGYFRSRSSPVISMPGVQKPH